MLSLKSKVFAMVACLFLSIGMIALSVVPVCAYSTTIGGTKTMSFDKYLVMDKDANVPVASFKFQITAGTPVAASSGNLAVLAGIDPDKVVMAGVGTSTANTIAFSSADSTSQDANDKIKNYDNTTEKYAKKTGTLDFSACAFKSPGVYRYVITESGSNQAITNDNVSTRTVDVYVEDDAGALKIAAYILHAGTGAVAADGTDPSGKSQGFTNALDSSNLTIRSEVSGNQADKGKYFEFTVAISNAVAGTKYNVDISGAESSPDGKTNPTVLTVGSGGTVTQKFYLRHGQQIAILGISKDTTYNVTVNNEDYTTTPAGVTSFEDSVNGTIASADISTSYLNSREGVIPTGVLMTVAPFAIITLLGGAGAVTVAMKKKES